MFTSAAKPTTRVKANLFPDEAWELIVANRESDNLVILDVSTPGEYKDLHLEGALNISLFSRFFKSRVAVMDKRIESML